MTAEPSVLAALARVMTDVGAIGKDGASGQGYSFRGIDSVLAAVAPSLRRHQVVVVPFVESAEHSTVEVGQRRTPMNACRVVVSFRWYGPAGDHIECRVAAEAADSADKATTKALSIAFRTAILQTLALPTEDTGITAPQMRHLFALFSEAGIEDRAERLQYAAAVVGRDISSSKDLTCAEAGEVIDSLLAGIAEPTHGLAPEELPV